MTGYMMHIMDDCYDIEGEENRENHMVEVKVNGQSGVLRRCPLNLKFSVDDTVDSILLL